MGRRGQADLEVQPQYRPEAHGGAAAPPAPPAPPTDDEAHEASSHEASQREAPSAGAAETVRMQASVTDLTALSLEHKVHGECVARCTLRTLYSKRWKPAFAVLDRPELLLLFRSKDDFADYLRGPPRLSTAISRC